MLTVTYHAFSPWAAPEETAEKIAEKIRKGELTPVENGDRYYRLSGWAFDIGRKPYLVEEPYGHIYRKWMKSVTKFRKDSYVSRKVKIVPDPFHAA